MKPMQKSFGFPMILVFSFIFAIIFLSSNVFAANTITGTIFDKQRNRLPEIDIELLDQYYRSIDRTKTDGAGTYTFTGLSNGNFTIRVYAFRYDLEDQDSPIEIESQNSRGGVGSGYFYRDIYLLPKRGGLKEAELSVIFAQEVPKEAKDLYEKAIKELDDKRTDAGIAGLYEAVKIFPNYFAALYRLGMELTVKGDYAGAFPAFFKAASVNQKSALSYYWLAFTLHKSGTQYNKAAIASVNKAAILAPSSPQVFWLMGKIERAMGNFPDAEKHLLQAKKLSTTKNPDIHKELAELYGNDLKKFNEAADELELYMKAAKLSNEEEEKVKKVIVGLREKAKTQPS